MSHDMCMIFIGFRNVDEITIKVKSKNFLVSALKGNILNSM